MIANFINTITDLQLSVVIFLILYFLVYGVRYHLLVLYAVFSGRGINNDWLGQTLNWLAYIAIGFCLYWWV